MFERQYNIKINKIHSDNGTEYVNNRMKSYFQTNGMIHWTTTPYTAQQNGVAERYNRTIVEMAKAMLYHANLPNVWWAEAVKTAVYTNNRLATSTLENMTPYEAFHGTKPDTSNMRVFGCVAFRLVPKELRRKLDRSAIRCILMEYEGSDFNHEFKGYRLWDPVDKKIHYSREVVFREDSNYSRRATTPTIVHDDLFLQPSPYVEDDIIDATDDALAGSGINDDDKNGDTPMVANDDNSICICR
jgi:hypothetical protein